MLTWGDILGLLGVYGYVTAIVIFTWMLRDRLSNPRKMIHILTGGIVFFWWAFDTREVMAFLAAAPFVLILILSLPASPVRFLREGPLGTRSSEGHGYGLVMYAISWTIIAYLLFDDLFAASIAIASMSFGDGMGELIGRRYGRRTYLNHRTVEGSAAVFISTFSAIMILAWFYFDLMSYSAMGAPDMLLLFSAATAGLVTCLEAVTPGQIDNIVIPLTVGGYLHILGV